jgi:prolyl 4-hydroxylase
MPTTADSYHTPVRIMEGFLEPEKCKYLIDTYDKHCKRSTVVDALGNDVVDPARTSSTYFLPDSDPVVVEMKRRSAELTGSPYENIEGLQIVRYTKGEQYKFHYDYFDAIRHNQRVHTVLIYLNDLEMEDGGATIFKKYRVKVYPRCGRAIWFRNMVDGKVNDMSLHAGEELTGDKVKYAINVWIREKAVGPSEPPLPSNTGMTFEEDASGSPVWKWIMFGVLTVLLAAIMYVALRGGVGRVFGRGAGFLTRFVSKFGGGGIMDGMQLIA